MTTKPHSSDQITIVDSNDYVTGSENRTIARQQGLIHRIVKVIVMNKQGRILIQQRSATMEDSPLKWDLSATGHVDAGEDYIEAAYRETEEEIGLTDLNLNFIGKYYYERPKNELTIRRFNAIFIGVTDQKVSFNPSEVAKTQWITPRKLVAWLNSSPHDFTRSFTEIFDQFGTQILGHKSR